MKKGQGLQYEDDHEKIEIPRSLEIPVYLGQP